MPALGNPRHEAVAQSLAMGKGITESYQSGGFAPTPASASKFAKRPEVVERINEIIGIRATIERKGNQIASERAGVDKEWIVTRAKYLVERCLRGSQPVLDKDGKPTGQFTGKPDSSAAVRALTLLAQMGGHLVHRLEMGGPGDFARMSDEELDASLAETAAAMGLPADAMEKLRDGTKH